MYTIPTIPSVLPTDPAAFLFTEQGRHWISALARSFPHARYERDRSTCFSLAQGNRFAAAMLEAKRTDCDIDELLQADLPPALFCDSWQYNIAPELRAALRERFDERNIEEAWEEDLRYAWEDIAADADKSSVTDLFTSTDRCELLFRFAQGPCLEDSAICSHKPWSEFSELAVTSDLQFALNNLGYTVAQYRRASGNRHPSYTRLKPTRPRRKPIIGFDKLEELVDNACSQYFHIYLFAIVPLTDIVVLDLEKPIIFEQCWVASANCWSGTFHEVTASGAVTVTPADGILLSGAEMAWSPDEICGFHTPHFHARVGN